LKIIRDIRPIIAGVVLVIMLLSTALVNFSPYNRKKLNKKTPIKDWVKTIMKSLLDNLGYCFSFLNNNRFKIMAPINSRNPDARNIGNVELRILLTTTKLPTINMAIINFI